MIINAISKDNSDIVLSGSIWLAYYTTKKYLNVWDTKTESPCPENPSGAYSDASGRVYLYSSYAFDTKTGEFSLSGSENRVLISDIPLYSGKYYVTGWTVSSDKRSVYDVTALTRTDSRLTWVCRARVDAMQKYDLVYGDLYGVALSQRTGDDWKQITLWK